MYWGDTEVDWEVLSSVAGVLNQEYHHLRSRFAVWTPNIRYLYRRFVEPEETFDVHHNRGSFIYELHRARHLHSKDPRDHVYAFLGHFSIHTGSKTLAEMQPDYTRPVEDIYYDVAVRGLRDAGSLVVLSACQHAVTSKDEKSSGGADYHPFTSQPSHQQQIGMAMIPEQNLDFSMLSLDNGSFNFQPQVFVVDTPDMPAPIDTSLLSGKTSNFAQDSFESDDEKVEIPVIERPIEKSRVSELVECAPADEEFEADPEFALFHSERSTKAEEPQELDTESLSQLDIFGGIEPEKALSRFELVDATEEEASAALAMARVQRISANIESIVSRLDILTMDL